MDIAMPQLLLPHLAGGSEAQSAFMKQLNMERFLAILRIVCLPTTVPRPQHNDRYESGRACCRISIDSPIIDFKHLHR